MTGLKRRIIVVGIGGASCSGKTLLAKNIRRVLPSNALLIHQDDFAPPTEQVPYSDKYPDIQDWDDPPGAIIWPDLRNTLQHVRKYGVLPPHHRSHDHLNASEGPSMDEKVLELWTKRFQRLSDEQRKNGEELLWVLMEGFILYWDQAVIDALDVRLFLRVPYDTLKRRRDARAVYICQNPAAAADGEVWEDPPNYFEKIVYPAYVKAHQAMFKNGDVETGEEAETYKTGNSAVTVLNPGEGPQEISRIFEESCESIIKGIKVGAGAVLEEQKN